tara:strand:+ start:3521 stop:4177 length:657 start_codon:yes stop_codon:yes gene_type:complete
MAKIIFYCVQTGSRGLLPCIKKQKIDEFDFCFVHDNSPEAQRDKGWKYFNISNQHTHLGNPKRQRLYRFLPRLLFKDFDYTVYVDSKFYQSKKFYSLCLQIINEEKPNWMTCYHKDKRTFEQEIEYAIEHKNIPETDIKKVISNVSSNKWVSYDTCWIIRKNTDKNHDIGHKWFELTNRCFSSDCRDQLTLSNCIDRDYVNTNHSIQELENHSIIRHV